jgi:molybdate transport system substrate-binding protein
VNPIALFNTDSTERRFSERIASMKATGIAVAAAMLLSMPVQDAAAQEAVRVLISNGLKAAMEELQPLCERAIGRPLAMEFSSTAALKARIEAGDPFDAALVTVEAVTDLIKQSKVAAESRTDLGRSPLVVGIRAGAPRADIGSPEALKRTLQQAKSITYLRDGASRDYLERMFAQLGIAAELKPKIILATGSGPATQSVAAGQAQFVLTLASETAPVPGVEVLGPLPAALAYDIRFAGAASATTTKVEAVKTLLLFLARPQAVAVFKANGVQSLPSPVN